MRLVSEVTGTVQHCRMIVCPSVLQLRLVISSRLCCRTEATALTSVQGGFKPGSQQPQAAPARQHYAPVRRYLLWLFVTRLEVPCSYNAHRSPNPRFA